MDGVLLVFDSRSLPNLHALAPVEDTLAPRRSHWRNRTLPAMAALILATVFSLVYFVSTHTVPSATPISGASVTDPLLNPDAPANSPDLTQTAAPPARDANSAAMETAEAKREDNAKAPVTTPPAPAKKPSAVKSSTQPKSAEEPKKEDSKVGSILKKTGNIL